MARMFFIWFFSRQKYLGCIIVLILSTIIFLGIIWREFFGLSIDDVARCVALLFNWSVSGQGISFRILSFYQSS